MKWLSRDGRYEVEIVDLNGVAHYRLRWLPGRYYQGDYRGLDELLAAVPGLDLADLVRVDDLDDRDE